MKVMLSDTGEIKLRMRLNVEPGATGRPDEVLNELGFNNTNILVKRTRLILSKN